MVKKKSWKWLEIAGHGFKWLEWLEMAVITQNGRKWREMAGNGWDCWTWLKWRKMTGTKGRVAHGWK